MPKFTVNLTGYVGRSVEVEADDWEAAVETAMSSDDAYLGLCHHCARDWDPGEAEASSVEDETGALVAEVKFQPSSLVAIEEV